MKEIICISFALIGMFLAPNSFACDMPREINIPNGSAATAEEMTTAGQNFHQFMLNMQNYQNCLEDETNIERTKPGDPSKSEIQARENQLVSLHNAASDAMTKTAEGFSKAVADFEARQ